MQPTNANFSAKYWTNAGAIATEIRSGALNKNNVKEKLDAFCDSMKVEKFPESQGERADRLSRQLSFVSQESPRTFL